MANIISLKPKVSISLLIYQKYHSNEAGISLKTYASKPFGTSKKSLSLWCAGDFFDFVIPEFAI